MFNFLSVENNGNKYSEINTRTTVVKIFSVRLYHYPTYFSPVRETLREAFLVFTELAG